MPIAKLHFKVGRLVTNQEGGGPTQRVYRLDLIQTGETMDQRDGLVTWTPAMNKEQPAEVGFHGEINLAEIVAPGQVSSLKLDVGDEVVVDLS